MKKSIAVCLLCLSVFARSQSAQYQPGKIVSVQKLEDSGTPGGTDAPVKSGTYSYDVSIQVGDVVYTCRYQAQSGEAASWLLGEDRQVRIKGKIMYLKRATGKDAKLTILHKAKADNS